MKLTYGNSFRYNDLHIATTQSVVCFADETHASLCHQISKAFLHQVPFGFIGVAPWFGVVTNALCTPGLLTHNLAITDLFLAQHEIGAIIFLTEDEKYLNYVKESLPDIPYIIYNSKKHKITDITKFCLEIVQPLTTPSVDTNREFAEWMNLSLAEDVGEKRLLLVGDSISRGYSNHVRELLPDYTVDTLNTSEGTDHPNIYQELALAFDERRYNVIHFNNGIHLHNISDEKYGENLRSIFQFIRKTTPKSRLIFGTTTSVNKQPTTTDPFNTQNFKLGDRNPNSAKRTQLFDCYDPEASMKYIELNEIAINICADMNIDVTDLFRVCIEEELPKTDRVHLTAEGYEKLAQAIVANVLK